MHWGLVCLVGGSSQKVSSMSNISIRRGVTVVPN
jgi:hypothetical protein